MIRIADLHFGYGKKEILRGVTAALEAGALTGLFGPNGSGKTTLFKCCLKLVSVRKGSIRYQGRDLCSIPIGDLSRIAAHVPQEHEPPFPFKVKEIVLMGRTPHMGWGVFSVAAADMRAALEALERVGIIDLADARYDQLSGGQRQLVIIARAVAQQTPVLFLDEPTSALDFSNQIRIWRILKELAATGITVVACSHDPNHILWFCDRVIALNQGSVFADGPPWQALTETALAGVYRESWTVGRVDGLRVVVPRIGEAG